MPPPESGGLLDAIFGITIISILVSLLIAALIIGVVSWAIWRNAPARRDPAEEALRQRLARGEIDRAEVLVRMRALHHGADRDIT